MLKEALYTTESMYMTTEAMSSKTHESGGYELIFFRTTTVRHRTTRKSNLGSHSQGGCNGPRG